MFIANMTSDDFKASAKNVDTVVIPVGAVEAHGHHCPLGTDIFCPEVLIKKVDELMGESLWITPAVPFGVCYDLSVYPGTATVPSDVLAEYLYFAAKSFVDQGAKNVIFMNGHGGNNTAVNLAAEKLVNQACAVVLNISWWLDYSREILTICEGQGHAGEDETSVAMAYCEEYVQTDKACANPKKPLIPARYPQRGRLLYENAISGDATKASKEKGDRIVELVGAKIAERIRLVQQGRFITE